MEKIQRSGRARQLIWIAAIWSVYGVIDSTQTVLIMRSEVGQHSWPPLFLTEFASWLPWVLATPLVGGMARRFRATNGVTAAVHLAACTVLSLAASAWSALLLLTFNPWGHAKLPDSFFEAWGNSLLYLGPIYLFVYGLIFAITLAIDYRENVARQHAETARLSVELSAARFAALRGQMEPHFIFNVLNSIAGLVRDKRNDDAVGMIVALSEFLRRATEDSQQLEVSLADEFAYLQRYLDIQKVRFGERLDVSVEIPPELLRARVPSLLLQPLVENGIKHGIATRIAGGAIRVSGARHDANLHLRVFNDGPNLPDDRDAQQNGVGIANLRARLGLLHHENFDLQLRNVPSGGVEVLVTLPFREA